MSEGLVAALIAGVATLVTSVITAVILLLNARHKINQEKEAAAVGQYMEIVNRQEEQIKRLSLHTAEQQCAITSLYEDHAECQGRLEGIYTWMTLFHTMAERMARICKADGHDLGEVPPMPPRPPYREAKARAETVARETAHNTGLLQQAGQSTRDAVVVAQAAQPPTAQVAPPTPRDPKQSP
jgi:hypothetical protein